MLLYALSFFFAVAADTQTSETAKPVTLPEDEMQLRTMMNSIRGNLNASHERKAQFAAYLFTDAQNTSDVCSWRGVLCAVGMVRALVFTSPIEIANFPEWKLEINWLPSSIKHIHLSAVQPCSAWLPERLPRELQYFYYSGYSKLPEGVSKLRLRNLPKGIEELHLIGVGVGGSIQFR